MLNWGKREFRADGSDWHESGVSVDNIGPDFNPICTRIEQVQQKEIDGLPEFEREHVLRALKMGKAWLIEPLQDLQPKSFAVLDEFASEFKLAFHWYDSFVRRPPVITSMLAVGWVEVRGRVVTVEVNRETYENQYGDDPYWLHYELSIPEEISKSWLWRTNGWSINASLPGGGEYHQMVYGKTWTTPVDSLLSLYKKAEQKKVLLDLRERIPNVVMTRKRMDGTEFETIALRAFIDTRPDGLHAPVGDQLLVVTYTTDRIVYHIHDGDVRNIRVLHDPAEAIDAYCAHTLLRTPGRFDFMAWSDLLA